MHMYTLFPGGRGERGRKRDRERKGKEEMGGGGGNYVGGIRGVDDVESLLIRRYQSNTASQCNYALPIHI